MTFRGLAALAVVGATLLMAACGDGSGRRGTDIAVSGSGPSTPVQAGQDAVFNMTVTNQGENVADEVAITNLIGNGMSLASITCVAAGGATCPDPTGVVMTVLNLPAGGRLDFVVTTTLAQVASGTVTNSMSATYDTDPDRSNNSVTATADAFNVSSDLVVSGNGPAGTVTGGDTVAFEMTVTNNGPDVASNLHFSGSTGNGLGNATVTCAAGGGAACPATLGAQMDLASMPVGGTLVFTVGATVNQNFNGTATQTLQVTADTDSDRSDNSFTATATVVTPRAAIVVTGQGPTNVAAGTTASFVMTLSNPTGPDAAAAVHLVNTVGNNLTLTSITCSASGGATCPATGAVMDVSNLPVGGVLEFTVGATVAPGTHGTILNTLDARVTSGVLASATAVGVGSAYANNVSVAGVAPPGPLTGGEIAHFAITIANAGPGPATDVGVNTVPSSGLGPTLDVTCTQAVGVSCPQTPGAAMTIPSLPANASLVLDVAAPVVAGTNANVAVTTTATAAGDSRLADNTAIVSVGALSPDLGVGQTVAGSASAGGTAVFTATVSNPAAVDAVGLTLTQAFGGAVTPASFTISCSPAAICPATTGQSMTLATLPARQTLTFTITAQLPDARGQLTGTFSVASANDPNAANNQSTVATNVIDARNGSYKAFAADGRVYDLTIDFDAGSYTMAGANGTVQRSFTADATGGGFTVSGNSRFRVAADLVVGGHDFGSGVLPYVAGRQFASTVAETVGTFNLMTRNVPAGATPSTHAAVVVVNSNSMQICQADGGTIAAPGHCPAGKQKNYTLDVGTGGSFTATEVGGASQFSFYMARSGALKILLGGAPAASAGALRIGLQDSPSLIGGTLSGASTSGNWIASMTITATDYTVANSGTADDAHAVLTATPNTGVGAMLSGARQPGGDLIWVMQASPLALAFADPTATVAAQGLLQIAIP